MTWASVGLWLGGHGVGTVLFAVAVGELKRQCHAELARSSFLGNQSSMLWHWRMSFQLWPLPVRCD